MWIKNIFVKAARQKGMSLREWLIHVGVKQAEIDLGMTEAEFREKGEHDA